MDFMEEMFAPLERDLEPSYLDVGIKPLEEGARFSS